ncbi:MAG: tetratricopeptide repeat protein [Candidatus Electronema sp. VV]
MKPDAVKQDVFGSNNVFSGTGPVHVEHHHYPAAPPPIPRHLPSLEPCFLHREEELIWLNDRLHPGKVAAVCGPGGMGKSALAAQAVHQLEAARFPDGIIFHSFYHQPKVETALQAICAAYQVEAKAGLETTVRTALAGRKALLILDGTEQADDLPALLRLRGGCGVLITSRKRTDAQADRLDLKPLDEQPAAEVFRLYSGVAADDAGVQGICKLLGGWPVALRIAGRYLSTTGESAADYLQWLEQEPFKELAGGQHQEENAALLLRRSVDAVSGDARLALGLAGCLAFAPIAREPVAAILDGDERRARAALNELVNYGLLEKREERWQISHALVHTYARTELAMNKEKVKQIAACYIFFAAVNSKAGALGYVHLDKERTHCLHLLEICLKHELRTEMLGLIGAIYNYIDRQGYWTEQLTAVNMFLCLAEKNRNLHDKGWCLNSLGYAYDKRRKYATALNYYEQSLVIRQDIGDKQGIGATKINIAGIYRRQGNYPMALQYCEQSLAMMREFGDKELEGTALNNISQIYAAQGDHETALKYLKQSLAIRPEAYDKEGEGITLNNIGRSYHDQGDVSNALEHQKNALAIFCEIGDKIKEACTRWGIGRIYQDQGDLAKAEEYMSQAVQIAEAIDHPSLEKYRDRLKRVRAARQAP